MTHGPVRVIVNPISGRGQDARFIPELVRHLTLRGFSVDVRPTEGPGHASGLAREAPDDARCIVSVGGDGTHREVLSGVLGRLIPVCVVPSGTENVLGRTFGLLGTVEDTVRRIQANRCVEADVGMADSHPFIMFSGIGFDAAVTKEVQENRRGSIHRDAYYGPIARLWWRYKFPMLTVKVDGHLLVDDAGFVLVANTPQYCDRLRLAPQAVSNDGLLDVVCFRTQSRWQILNLYIRAKLGRHIGHPVVACGRGKRIEVTCREQAAPVQVDGDTVLTTPIVYTLLPKAVRLLV